uniref:IgA-specific serine endopeptidase autotransporter n=1 Tax=Anthurium amnicola TaxID=1678845 RepID=A0A1D1YU88_9ARAE
MEGGDCDRELQLLPRHSAHFSLWKSSPRKAPNPPENPHLDLNLSIGVLPPPRPPSDEDGRSSKRHIHALKLHAAEQIKLAAVEKAYAEEVREMTKREMELAEKEFARARLVWERAREEVGKAERMKELATQRINSACTEITCQACRQRFRP